MWVFWFNVPLGVIGTVWGAIVLHETARHEDQVEHDILGNLFCVIGLTGLVLGLSDAGLDGWSAPMVASSAYFFPAAMRRFSSSNQF